MCKRDYTDLDKPLTKRKWGWFAIACNRGRSGWNAAYANLEADLVHGLGQHLTGFAFTRTAAIGAAGAGLKLGETADAFARGAANVAGGHCIA